MNAQPTTRASQARWEFFALAATLWLAVWLASCGGNGDSTSQTPPNLIPSIYSLDPTSAGTGDAGFTLTVTGSNFISSSVVRWNGADRMTTFVSTTRLTAAIPASDIAVAGTANVTVFNPGAHGGTSTAHPFTIYLKPTLSSLSPDSGVACASGLELTVLGTEFVEDSQVLFAGHAVTTTFGSDTELTASVPAADLNIAHTVAVAVDNPPFDGTARSNIVSLPIVNPLPAISSLAPSIVPAGSPAFSLAIDGTNFAWNSKLRWNGSDRSTTRLSCSKLTATILPSDVAAEGVAEVTVFNPAPEGGVSDPVTFTIGPAPAGRNDTRATATPISNAIISASISPYADEDFYSFQAPAGATVIIEITARRLPSPSLLDSVLEIQDGSGARPSTCRSPDRPFSFLTFMENDSTPNEFDDTCVNDDISTGVIQDSFLEFQPQTSGTYYIRVLDLRGDGRPDLIYELSLSGAD